ncbi:MAG: Zn-dependent hydrolase [Alphaproteobacteria bacterium]|nr:Zn-dependent hydrolase [Alphaproteobacteria bacterium]
MNPSNLRVDRDALMARLEALAQIGAAENGACCRLALSDDDKAGRDVVVSWMREHGLEVSVDAVGNVFGMRAGRTDGKPVMTGSHIDTVRTGGRYDGNYGVLAGLEVVRALDRAGIVTSRPLCVAFFTNEEGARFAPDMLGSLAHVGGLSVGEARATRAIDGAEFGAELDRIGYAGDMAPGTIVPHAFVELHIEQGPVLDAEGITIGAVEDLQGISWQELTITGQSNHAGTTPMRLRRDAGFAAAMLAAKVRIIARDLGGAQVGTVGKIDLHPNLINVIAARATMTVDLRNTDETILREAERLFAESCDAVARVENVEITARRLARFEPVAFDQGVVRLIEEIAGGLGHSCRRMTSGAGHDAQMMARICPTAMIFVPSVRGISHNPAEHTDPADLGAGADVLLQALLRLAEQE